MANGSDVVGEAPQEADATAAGGAPGAGPPGGGPSPGPPGGGGGALPFLTRGPQPSAPGAGDQAAAMTAISNAIAMIQGSLPKLLPGSPLHKDALSAVTRLSRHMAQGQPTAGVQQTQVQDLLRNLVRNALLSRIMQSQNQGQGGGVEGGPAGPMPNVPPQGGAAPMPSTPLPGA